MNLSTSRISPHNCAQKIPGFTSKTNIHTSIVHVYTHVNIGAFLLSYLFYVCVTLIISIFFQMAAVAEWCLREDPVERPEMRDIVKVLSQIVMSSIEWEASLGGNSKVFSGLYSGR